MLFSPARRHYLADKFGQLANIFAATLIIGQFVGSEHINIGAFIFGIVGSVAFYVAGFLSEEPRHQTHL